jgi:hypothetical protein
MRQDEAGRWPAIHIDNRIPGALPRAGMIDAFGVEDSAVRPECPNGAELKDGHVWIVANRDIKAGEELTFNYGFDLEDYRKYPCHCGAPACVGFIVAEEFFDHVMKRR